MLSKAISVNTTLVSALRPAALAQNVIRDQQRQNPASFLNPYKKDMELAAEEINAAGGVNGKQLSSSHEMTTLR